MKLGPGTSSLRGKRRESAAEQAGAMGRGAAASEASDAPAHPSAAPSTASACLAVLAPGGPPRAASGPTDLENTANRVARAGQRPDFRAEREARAGLFYVPYLAAHGQPYLRAAVERGCGAVVLRHPSDSGQHGAMRPERVKRARVREGVALGAEHRPRPATDCALGARRECADTGGFGWLPVVTPETARLTRVVGGWWESRWQRPHSRSGTRP